MPSGPPFPVPGIRREESSRRAAPLLATGVPAFLGFAARGAPNAPERVTRWSQFEELAGAAPPALLARPDGTPFPAGAPFPDGFLHHAVRGFFDNGGTVCHVVLLRDPAEVMRERGLAGETEGLRESLRGALAALELDEVPDLVAFPDAMRGVARALAAGAAEEVVLAAEIEAVGLQYAVVEHCTRMGTRFALLDGVPGAGSGQVNGQARALRGRDAALYHPWIRTLPDGVLPVVTVPPSGHVAGVFARTDARAGVHKAPANEAVEGVTDLATPLGEAEHREIVPEANCLRAFPRRGILVWGARTLAGEDEAAWRYVPVRRLFLQVARWIGVTLADKAFEPNDAALWSRITREVSAYMAELYRAGALAGSSPAEAYYVRCDQTTNPPELVALGQVVTEIGLAARAPHEFVVVRVTHDASGTHVSGPLPG